MNKKIYRILVLIVGEINMTYEGIRLKIRKLYMHLTAKHRLKQLKNPDFTIISNNCWGGIIYQSYGLKYTSPTIGCFIMADDYLTFIKDIKKYLKMQMKEIKPEDSHSYDIIKNKDNFGTYPIGCLGDVEIHFLHYDSFEEAKEKWERRTKRINYDRILYKYDNQNACTKELLEKFSNLPLKNKVCFISEPCENLNNTIYIKASKRYKEIKISYEPFGSSKYININNLLNNL